MQIGAVFPQTEIGTTRDPGVIRAYAERVEALGYQHVLVYDHVLGADTSVHTGWRGPYDLRTPFREPFVLFGYLAAVTKVELSGRSTTTVLPSRSRTLVIDFGARTCISSLNILAT